MTSIKVLISSLDFFKQSEINEFHLRNKNETLASPLPP